MSGSATLDDYGYFGPKYDYADNIPLPNEIGVRQEPSISAIIDSVGGVNYYIDTIAFGSKTFFNQHDLQPMGTRYYLNTGTRCSNGATMSTYYDGVTKGNLLGQEIAYAMESAGLPGLKGLAPGMLENARDALDPRPIFSAVTGTGYPVCQQVTCPVGDIQGAIINARESGGQPYIIDPVKYNEFGIPTQTRWVQAYDKDGYQIQVSKDEFAAQPKCYNADGSYMTNPPAGCPTTEPAQISQLGSDPYSLCTVIQPAVLPPTIPQTSEGFRGADESEQRMWLMLALGLAGVGTAVYLTRR